MTYDFNPFEDVAMERVTLGNTWQLSNFWDTDVQNRPFPSILRSLQDGPKTDPMPSPSLLTPRSNERTSSFPLRPDPSRNARWAHDSHAPADSIL
jgi:hypothetical protein